MGLTKQYLRFQPGPIYGIISSAAANILFVCFRGKKKDFVAVPACENVLIWNYRTSECVHVLRGDKYSVTCLTADNVRNTLAVGYADGAVRVFDLNTGLLIVLLAGHKSAVSSLAYDEHSLRLSSGGKDTEIVLWDVVGETGLFRLRGHKGPITGCCFLGHYNVLVTSSEDTLLKFWNLESQHCFKTLVGSRGEIWDFVILKNCRLIAGINDSDLRVWDLKFSDDAVQNELNTELDSSNDKFNDVENLTLVEVGKILTTGEKKTISVGVDKGSRILGCHGYAKSLLLFKLLNHEEALKKMNKRKKKAKKLMADQPLLGEENYKDFTITLSDEIERMKAIQTNAKIVNFHIMIEKFNVARVTVLLNDNSFSVYSIDVITKEPEPILLHNVKSAGHRSYVRTLSFSSDSSKILSASNESVKIWNRDSQVCTHTFSCEMALCSLFVTGDNYCIIGMKTGQLRIYELSSHQLVESIDAHEGSASCLAASPDQSTIATGSSDKDVKFWAYELVKDEQFSETKKRLTLLHTRTLKMSDEIQCVKYSPNGKFFAVSLLDCTVKVVFSDTLKFAFSLYGHKLPVPCMDISYDGTLLATGSKDKNIKIWSLEFGNCLKSIFAHNESIVCLQFLPKTHMMFTASTDKKVKQWDCDNFQKIITLEGHQGNVSAMAISPNGTTVVTASHDKSLRLWEKTGEPLVLEEEREVEQEQLLEKELTANEPVIVGEENKEVGLAARTTVQTLKTTEQLIEAIDIFKSEIMRLEEYKLECKSSEKILPMPHPMFLAYSVTCPYEYILKVLEKSKSSNLEKTLLHLPFNYAVDFLKILAEFAKRKWELELSTRCILFLLRIHLCQIILCPEMFPIVKHLQSTLFDGLSLMKDVVGFNLFGLRFLQKQIEACEEVSLFKDAAQRHKRKCRKRDLIAFI